MIRVTDDGWEYEPDQRHADLIIQAMDLQEAKGVQTPYEEEKGFREEEEEAELKPRGASEFRAAAARANYLALDRPDIQYAVKEVCRGMAKPRKRDWRKLKRLARHLVSHPRTVLRYDWQEGQAGLDGFTDSDWAGCARTAKSTSGGVILVGSHCLKSWSATQKSVTLSSGEAELVAAVKMSTELLGLIQLARDWGVKFSGRVLIDSSAALAVVRRKGNGKLRHIRVGSLWVQQTEKNGDLAYTKVWGKRNPADLLTKGLGKAAIDQYTKQVSQERRQGRAEESLQV